MNPCSLLIVDDNPSDLLISKISVLKFRPYSIIEEAASGLVLLDLKLPGMDGIEVLRGIRASAKIRYIPVVMVTSSTMEEDMKASYDAGANGFLHKAHDFSKFTQSLEAAVHYWMDVNLTPDQ